MARVKPALGIGFRCLLKYTRSPALLENTECLSLRQKCNCKIYTLDRMLREENALQYVVLMQISLKLALQAWTCTAPSKKKKKSLKISVLSMNYMKLKFGPF